jgi:ABC-type Fe3+-hydroxamate transport system substrate-binding protein
MDAVDGRGRRVELNAPPRRIVSLVPSSTEALWDMGVGGAIVGVTRYCTHPREALNGVAVVGGTKDVDVSAVAALRPDLVVANCEENTREAIEALEQQEIPVWAAFPRTVDAALADLAALGRLVGRAEVGVAWGRRGRDMREILRERVGTFTFTYAWMIWRRPWMAVSDDTFIASMLAEAGGRNALASLEGRFPEVAAEALGAADPDVVLLSSEPMPFSWRHADELAAASGVPRSRFRRVDGSFASWHGTRMAAGFAYLAGLVDGLTAGARPARPS